MESEVARTAFGQGRERTESVGRTRATEERERTRQSFYGNTVIDHVHHAAQDAGAIEQGRWAAEHLHLADRQRIDAHRVIGTGAGGIEAARAVLRDLQAIAFETADHRAARVRTEIARSHAGDVREQVAEGGYRKRLQSGAAESQGGRHRSDFAADSRALDYDRLELLRGGLLRGDGERGGSEEKGGVEGAHRRGFLIAIQLQKGTARGNHRVCSPRIIARTTATPHERVPLHP